MDPIHVSEAKFYKTIQAKLKLVRQYEDLNLLNRAIEIVPAEELSLKATLKLSLLEKSDPTIVFEDLLLLELMNWFKMSFFTWVDVPKCASCGQTPKESATVSPNETERQWSASTVEQYFCTTCQLYVRFPRYNDPQKLLETRCGRCGEWANCFTLLCRALGYDARFVCDWNDHVWTEVFSFSKNRWLHCDPCENICDKPLLYELGWKKPISYVLAFSKDEVQDVTWRYTSKFAEVMKRRNLCREEWLLNCIFKCIDKLQRNVSAERKKELSKRRALELADFLTEPEADEDYGGRTSGSLAWRIARGEMQMNSISNSYVFVLTDREIEQKYLHVKYSCALDKYIRISDESAETENWSACTFEHNNIFRKVETDWKVVYLARTEESDKGAISWKFRFNDSGLAIETLRLHLKGRTFESGKVNWFLSSENNPHVSKRLSNNDVVSLKTGDLKGCTSLTLTAELTEGNGRAAWQHSQLFRQELDSTDFPFEVEIFLNKQ